MENIKKKVVIIGAGGFARETLDVFEAINLVSPRWHILGFIDDNPTLIGQRIRNYPVLGNINWLKEQSDKNIKAVIAIGDNKVRKRIAEDLKSSGIKFCSIVHPRVILTPHVSIGEGVIICAGCILTNNISIGDHMIINLDCTIGHDVVIEDYVNLSPGIHVSGNNTFKEGVFVGTGAVTIQGITIGKWSIIGAGAVVVRDIPDEVVAVGVPAKPIKPI